MTFSATQAGIAQAYVTAMRALCEASEDLTASAFRRKVTALTADLDHDLHVGGAYTRGAHDLAADISAAHGAPPPPPPDACQLPALPAARSSQPPGTALAAQGDHYPPSHPLAGFLRRF